MLSSQYVLILTHGGIFSMSQAAIQLLCLTVCCKNLYPNSVAIFFTHHAKSESKPLEKCMYVCH
jgi:hypothetical protein